MKKDAAWFSKTKNRSKSALIMISIQISKECRIRDIFQFHTHLVSAMFVAKTIFLTPCAGLMKTFRCSLDGMPECKGSTEYLLLLLNGWVLSNNN